MYLGDKEPSSSEFKASATDKDGNNIDVNVDLSKVDFSTVGVYDVLLSIADGQNKTVKLTIKENKQVTENNKDKAKFSVPLLSLNKSKTNLPNTGEKNSNIVYILEGILILLVVTLYGRSKISRRDE